MDVDELLKKMKISSEEYEEFKDIIDDAKKRECEIRNSIVVMRETLEEQKKLIDLLNGTLISKEIYESSKIRGEI